SALRGALHAAADLVDHRFEARARAVGRLVAPVEVDVARPDAVLAAELAQQAVERRGLLGGRRLPVATAQEPAEQAHADVAAVVVAAGVCALVANRTPFPDAAGGIDQVVVADVGPPRRMLVVRLDLVDLRR